MKLFAIRLRHPGGNWSFPWSLFAPDYSRALDRFLVENREFFAEITIREVRPQDMAAYERHDLGGGALQHPNVDWDA